MHHVRSRLLCERLGLQQINAKNIFIVSKQLWVINTSVPWLDKGLSKPYSCHRWCYAPVWHSIVAAPVVEVLSCVESTIVLCPEGAFGIPNIELGTFRAVCCTTFVIVCSQTITLTLTLYSCWYHTHTVSFGSALSQKFLTSFCTTTLGRGQQKELMLWEALAELISLSLALMIRMRQYQWCFSNLSLRTEQTHIFASSFKLKKWTMKGMATVSITDSTFESWK